MNWGERISILSVTLGLGTSVGYLVAHDWRRAIYFFLGAAITAIVVWR